MNNQGGIMTSLLAVGAAGAAIYGISRGIKNGTFQQLSQTVSNSLDNQAVEQIANSVLGMNQNQSSQHRNNR
ncbi:hypothetical protein [Pseudobacillus wudalianchiensis]|uniref:Uncharacterized protein n=1 Tax=Pseudobacillus wudalianchiensis TaxID=1743143 RepID=A0A1B9AZ18_9BACI|nr:hypothetical protein [Bacillus wudalianchiensis]OCA89074.1 hypothetical protein A8F95_06620 [Bacillus wudalianchiensis]